MTVYQHVLFVLELAFQGIVESLDNNLDDGAFKSPAVFISDGSGISLKPLIKVSPCWIGIADFEKVREENYSNIVSMIQYSI